MRRLSVGLAGLLVLVIFADRGGAWLMESQIERRLTRWIGGEVHADVLGVPFLTQALVQEFDQVVLNADAAEVRAYDLDVKDIQVELRGLRFDSLDTAMVDGLSAQVLVPSEELERQAQRAQLPAVSLPAAPGGDVRISGELNLGNRRVEVSATAEVARDGQVLVIEPVQVSVEGNSSQLDNRVSAQAVRLLSIRIPTTALPRGSG